MRYSLLLPGIVALALAWFIPIPYFDRHAFWAHMTVHMLVVAIAAPLLALGLAGSRFDPVPRAPHLFAPIPVSVFELIVVWAWHAPVLHHLARNTTGGLIAEQSLFLLTGLAMWLSACGGHDAESSSRRAAGVVGLLLTSMHMTLLGALLALAPRPLFQHADVHHAGVQHAAIQHAGVHHVAVQHPYGQASLTPLEDQHLGGAIMLLVGGISYMAGGLWLTLGLIRSRQVRQGEQHDQLLFENRG